MRRARHTWIVAAVFTASVALAAYWMLSGLPSGRAITYDLSAPESSGDRPPTWRQRVGAYLLPLLYSHDTQYAPLYQEAVFRGVIRGQNKEEVRTALGEPLEKTRLEDGRTLWHYTKPGVKTQDFLVRIVEFDAADRVLRTHAEFYID
jgi:hypothetical protein